MAGAMPGGLTISSLSVSGEYDLVAKDEVVQIIHVLARLLLFLDTTT